MKRITKLLIFIATSIGTMHLYPMDKAKEFLLQTRVDALRARTQDYIQKQQAAAAQAKAAAAAVAPSFIAEAASDSDKSQFVKTATNLINSRRHTTYKREFIDTSRTRSGIPFICHAAAYCDAKTFEDILKLHVNVKAADTNKQTALFYAAKNRKTENLRLLLQYNANVAHVDDKELSALNCAVHHETFSMLLNRLAPYDPTTHGVDLIRTPQRDYINRQNASDRNRTPLMTAALFSVYNPKDPKTELLIPCFNLGARASINAADDDGNTAIFYAIWQNPANIPILVFNGADLSHRNKKGETPRQFAQRIYTENSKKIASGKEYAARAAKAHEALQQLKLTLGTFAKTDKSGAFNEAFKTLADSIEANDVQAFNTLLQRPFIRENIRDIKSSDEKTTPLMVAASRGTLHHLKELEKIGALATLLTRDSKKASACTFALSTDNVETLCFLLDHGAPMGGEKFDPKVFNPKNKKHHTKHRISNLLIDVLSYDGGAKCLIELIRRHENKDIHNTHVLLSFIQSLCAQNPDIPRPLSTIIDDALARISQKITTIEAQNTPPPAQPFSPPSSLGYTRSPSSSDALDALAAAACSSQRTELPSRTQAAAANPSPIKKAKVSAD